MADRDANRLAAAAEPELPTGAACFTIRHRVCLSVEVQCGLHADGRAIERAGGAAEKGVVSREFGKSGTRGVKGALAPSYEAPVSSTARFWKMRLTSDYETVMIDLAC
jgi:hypothetical protein